MEKTDITIIGAGIVGLAVSARLSEAKRSIFVLEQNEGYGQETSSRNSEVVHAGIYYPRESLKARCCLEGNRLIYETSRKNGITCKQLGKLVVAVRKEDIGRLIELQKNGELNGVPGLKILTPQDILELEPNIKAEAALFSPSTGIVDTHNLMKFYHDLAKAQGAEFVFGARVTAVKKEASGYLITIRDTDQSDFTFASRVVINCAGLNSDKIAALAGIDTEAAGYSLNFCKGQYFRVTAGKSRMIRHLIYPLPDEHKISLGIHATPDLGGGLRLGPDAEYIEREQADYNVDPEKKDCFAKAVGEFLPFITGEDLSADIAGIRPKLQGPQGTFQDFVVAEESPRGLPGFINLIGIDSPGLTCAPALAQEVGTLIQRSW